MSGTRCRLRGDELVIVFVRFEGGHHPIAERVARMKYVLRPPSDKSVGQRPSLEYEIGRRQVFRRSFVDWPPYSRMTGNLLDNVFPSLTVYTSCLVEAERNRQG